MNLTHLHETKPLAVRSRHQRSSIKNVLLKNFSKFLRTPFSQNTSGRLLLDSFFKNRNVQQYFHVLGERIKICEISCGSMQQSLFSTYVQKIFVMQITEYQVTTYLTNKLNIAYWCVHNLKEIHFYQQKAAIQIKHNLNNFPKT